MLLSAFFALAGLLAVTASAVNIETVPVGNAGNAGEWSGESYGGYGPDRICGAVGYTYNIGKYEVTAGQYCEFLNAVAKTDTYGLYNERMWSISYGCRIERTGSSGSYTYSVASDWANRPVNYVSYWDACRFTNWLHNGQPTGAQDAGTTETGAYTLNGYNSYDGRTIQRNADWKWAVTSEDEWYKAAYHEKDGVTGDYWDYPTGTSAMPINDVADPDQGNNANYFDGAHAIGAPYYRTAVGEFENSESPYGTFDQGGNVLEWNEGVVYEGNGYSYRGLRGGSFESDDDYLLASVRDFNRIPTYELYSNGFRVSEVPEPTSIMLLALGGLVVMRRARK